MRSAQAKMKLKILASCGLVVGISLEMVGVQVKAQTLPKYDHVVLVIEENRSYSEVIGYAGAPFINSLATNGANMKNTTSESCQPR